MRLTRFTDYALRVLIHLGADPTRTPSIAEISRAYGVSQNHLMKVVQDLGKAGFVASIRGRSGGVRLAMAPDQINVGAVVRRMEVDFDLADCGACPIAPACGLTGALNEAVNAFLRVLDGYSLADLLTRPAEIKRLLELPR